MPLSRNVPEHSMSPSISGTCLAVPSRQGLAAALLSSQKTEPDLNHLTTIGSRNLLNQTDQPETCFVDYSQPITTDEWASTNNLGSSDLSRTRQQSFLFASQPTTRASTSPQYCVPVSANQRLVNHRIMTHSNLPPSTYRSWPASSGSQPNLSANSQSQPISLLSRCSSVSSQSSERNREIGNYDQSMTSHDIAGFDANRAEFKENHDSSCSPKKKTHFMGQLHKTVSAVAAKVMDHLTKYQIYR